MRFSVVLAVLSAATLGLAQNTIIEVGGAENSDGGIYQFMPNNLNNIANGTVITFRFTGASGSFGNHSVTQSTFDDPCNPVSGGFDSGWVFVPDTNVSPVPEWNLTITNATAPIWFFCKQLLPLIHCSAGMVGAINPPSSGNTFSAYQSNAAKSSASGQGEGGLVGIGASASTGPGPVASGVLLFPGVPGASTSPTSNSGGSGSNQNGSLNMAVNLFVVTLSMILGSYL